jgi:uncharacterized surface protein with fasciclin (FAS1) repeats
MTTIIDVANADGRFGMLVAALQAAGLADRLKEEGPFTLFAPTDSAFSALPDGQLANLQADLSAMTGVLAFHVVSGRFTTADLAGQTTLDSLKGNPLTVQNNGGTVSVEKASIIVPDLLADNGVVHVINAVLQPPTK